MAGSLVAGSGDEVGSEVQAGLAGSQGWSTCPVGFSLLPLSGHVMPQLLSKLGIAVAHAKWG